MSILKIMLLIYFLVAVFSILLRLFEQLGQGCQAARIDLGW